MDAAVGEGEGDDVGGDAGEAGAGQRGGGADGEVPRLGPGDAGGGFADKEGVAGTVGDGVEPDACRAVEDQVGAGADLVARGGYRGGICGATEDWGHLLE